MVTTRRSVFATPTIPVARALRRERRARIAEAEILPQSIPTQARSRKKSKSAEISAKTAKKNKAESISLTATREPTPQVTSNKVDPAPQVTLDLESAPPATQSLLPEPQTTQPFESVPQFTQIDSSQDPSSFRRQASVHSLPSDGSISPPPTSQAHQAQNVFNTALQHNLSQQYSSRCDDEDSMQLSTPHASQNPPSPTQRHTARARYSSRCDEETSTPNPSQNPPSSGQSHEAPAKNWFGTASTAVVSLPNPAAPIFQPAESLFHFAAGVPPPEETKPFDRGGTRNTGKEKFLRDDSIAACGNPGNLAARQHDATSKAVSAVVARMNGHNVSRSDYLSILDGMIRDPQVQVQLPPVLVEKYEEASREEASTLYNGGLIDKFVQATEKATNVTAQILLTSKITKRERRARGARNRAIFNHSSVASSSSMGQYNPQANSSTNNPGPAASANPLAGPSTGQPSIARLFPEPLTEANLNRAPDALFKTISREDSVCCDEERGVVRRTKGSVRAIPYPRRGSTDTLRMAHPLAEQSDAQHGELHDESAYSVYSASTGALHQQTEAKRVANSIFDGVRKMHEPGSYDAQCVRNAEAILEETARKKGKRVADSVRRGFDLLHCYDLLKQVNVGLLSDAILEHISDAPRPPRVNAQPSNFGHMQTRSYHDVPQPPTQLCEHAQLGWGFLSFAKVFHPIGSMEEYTETVRHRALP